MESYRHILCATDFSAGSVRAATRAAAIAACSGARLTLLHVVAHFPEDRSNQLIPPEDVDPQQYEEDEARRHLAGLAREAGVDSAELAVRFVTGSAWHEIVAFAGSEDADLLVVAEHAHGGLRDLLPSTVGHLSSHHHCELLIVPAATPA